MGEAWKPPKKQRFSETGEHWIVKNLLVFSGINVSYNLAGIPSEILQKRTSNMAPALSGYQRTIFNRWSRTKHNTSV
jgi:hypothetical protein